MATPEPGAPEPRTSEPLSFAADPVRLRRSLTSRIAGAAMARPGPWLRLLGQRAPRWADGVRLQPSFQLLLALAERTGARNTNQDWEAARAELRRLSGLALPVPVDVHVVDRRIPGPGGDIPLRVYRSYGARGVVPAVVYLHGGGFTVGDLDTHDTACRALAVRSGCVVIAVDYRLAPEHVFPAAVDDVTAAWSWVVDHADELVITPDAIGVMGDSAGGTLSAALCLEARRLGLRPPALQCLIYPLVDAQLTTDGFTTFADGWGLTTAEVEVLRNTYAPDPTMWDDPRMSPLRAEDHSGLPPAFIVTAGFDVLRDEGPAYAAALVAAGGEARHVRIPDMIHGFHTMNVVPDANAVAASIDTEVGRRLRAAAAAPSA